MKTKIIFILLCFLTLNVMGQGIIRRNKPQTTQTQPTKTKTKTKTASKPKAEKTCDTCGKVLSKCEYNGNHPEPEAAGYDVTFSCNVSSAMLYIDGEAYNNASCTRFLKTGSHTIKVTAEGYKDYQKSISVNRQNTSCSIALEKKPAPTKPNLNNLNGHEYVDLGLSVKWATCNVGATSLEHSGDKFAWGETSTKTEYTYENYKYSDGYEKYTKYNTQAKYGYKRFTDGKTTLESIDDAASFNWGGIWRTPTWDEFCELLSLCSWTLTSVNEVKGYMVKSSKNGNSIFIPISGIYMINHINKKSPHLLTNLSVDVDYHNIGTATRESGFYVRPVCP